ncbi:hypothetical protein [Haploplasma modicum]|uniref:hypothetical protein n=1 Tax=Haploplasma modicum TaxID=2150 RepID=UPI00047D5353|nr:hypothetical protein [Haploplasma modicum]
MNTNNKLVISATNYARVKLNLDENFWVVISEGKHFLSNNHSGMYDKNHFLIRYNEEWLKNSTSEKTIKCAFHEVFHAFQHQEIIKRKLGLESIYFTNEELDKIEYEFQDEVYNVDKWESFLIEQQAEYFSDYLYSIFIKNNDTLSVIKEYYELFENVK